MVGDKGGQMSLLNLGIHPSKNPMLDADKEQVREEIRGKAEAGSGGHFIQNYRALPPGLYSLTPSLSLVSCLLHPQRLGSSKSHEVTALRDAQVSLVSRDVLQTSLRSQGSEYVKTTASVCLLLAPPAFLCVCPHT